VLTESEGDFVFDVGPTIITDKYTEYLKLVENVGLSHLLVNSAPQVAVVNGHDLHMLNTRAPVWSFLRTGLLPASAKVRLLASGLRLIKPVRGMNPYELSNRVRYDTESMETYLDRVFGAELNDLLIDALTRSMTLSTSDQASVIEFFAGAVAASGKMQTIKGGLQVLPDALAATLDVRLNCPVTAVRRTAQGVEIDYQDESGAFAQDQANACIITTRFLDAVNICPALKEPGADLVNATEYIGLYSMQLMYSRRTEKEPFIVMVPRAASEEVCAVFLEHLKAPDRSPRGTSHITVFFNLNSGIDFADWDDDRLITTAREFIEPLFPELRGHFRGFHLTRWPYAAHKGSVGYYKAVQKFLDAHPADDPVQLAGDYMSVAGQESAVVAGVHAAKKILTAWTALAPPRVGLST
jgi:protoporphyrinogen oxidase